MIFTYQLLTVPSPPQLSIATLSTVFVGTWAMSGGSKKQVEKGPQINAQSKDEENFIQYVHRIAYAQTRFYKTMEVEM